jgi:predicted amidohydrolase YtcJ
MVPAEMQQPADLVITAAAIHSMDRARRVYRSIAIRGERILAVCEDPHGLDGLRDDHTRLIHAPHLTLLPAMFDTHEHLLASARNLALVQPDAARSIADLIGAIRDRADRTPRGRWIVTSMGWNEANLAERRLPTAAELDRATDAHPVLCPRGGHVCTANSLALRLAGINRATRDPGGGSIARDSDGTPNGILEGAAAQTIKGLVPPASVEQQVDELAAAGDAYSALGVGAIREALLEPGQLEVYRLARRHGRLTIRCRPLLSVDPRWPLSRRLAYIDEQRSERDIGDDWLRVWGLKLVVDGGVAGAALSRPYADDPGFSGHLNWDPEELAEVIGAAVDHGWKVAAHAAGDLAVATVLNCYELVVNSRPGIAPAALAIEHAMLVDPSDRTRAVGLGVAITVQHYLLYNYGREIVRRWGPDRARAVMPVRSWLQEGAILSAGSDAAQPVNPMLTVWGMVTRGTRDAGVQGEDEAVDRLTAIELLTSAGARFTGELDRRGTLETGKLADFVAYEHDPLNLPLDELPELTPALTMVGGRAAHDPAHLTGVHTTGARRA